MNREYDALVAKVEAFTSTALARTQHDMACKRGCDACCSVWLRVSQAEAAELRAGLAALTPAVRAQVRERGRLELEREQALADATPRCALLELDGSCVVYAHRPLVCRTQGFALRYPAGFIPLAAVRARTSTGEVTHCPLNFTAAAPAAVNVLDAEHVDQILAVVNQRFSQANGLDHDVRHAIHALAAHEDVDSL